MFSRHIPSPLMCEEMNIDSLQDLQALQGSLKSFMLHVWESNEKLNLSNTQTGHMLQNEKLLKLFLV
jgi:hypothetical protein